MSITFKHVYKSYFVDVELLTWTKIIFQMIEINIEMEPNVDTYDL